VEAFDSRSKLLFGSNLRAENKCYTMHNSTTGIPSIDFQYPSGQTPIDGIVSLTLQPGAQRQFCYEAGTGANAVIGVNSGFMCSALLTMRHGHS
jgi:hypothetical protein